MKILCLQLARLGDIYQSWPALNALKRSGADVHLLTRSAYAAAAPTFVDRHWCLDTKAVVAPMIDEKPDIDSSLSRLNELVSALKAERFDRIVNLSYSPFSASFVSEIAHGTSCEVTGYTRFEDRTLAIPDDASAYFYAQVGVGKGNRVHVTDLFAHAAGVELTEADWNFESSTCPVVRAADRESIIVHLGASTLAKTLSWSKWLQVVKGLLTATDAPVILVGSQDEAEIAEKVSSVFGARKPLNLVGRTTLKELVDLVGKAKLVIGGDSAPVQIASLTNTPVYNLSFPMVSLWETGPRSEGSRILPLDSEDSYTSDEIVKDVVAMLSGRPPVLPVVRVAARNAAYIETKPQPQAFEWDLLRAIYMGELFPPIPNSTFTLGLQRLDEVNIVAIEQIAAIKKDATNQTASLILNRIDDVMDQIIRFVPEVAPLVRWFRVERLRIGPMPVASLIEATRLVHERFGEVLGLYLERGESNADVVLDKK